MLAKVISGGQNGADVAGLAAAKAVGLQTGGWMPNGFKTLSGPNPQRATLYGLAEHESPRYPPRTRANVEASDATLRLAYNFTSPGEVCTMKAIKQYDKPSADVQIYYEEPDFLILAEWQEVAEWLVEDNVSTLNVAGNGDSRIEKCVQEFLEKVFFHFGKDWLGLSRS